MHQALVADRIGEDGGGVRGLSPLIILSEAMNRLANLQGASEPLNPIDHFDVIAGTGTGG
jgi:patatin-like phospholipase/acyl hydrolase